MADYKQPTQETTDQQRLALIEILRAHLPTQAPKNPTLEEAMTSAAIKKLGGTDRRSDAIGRAWDANHAPNDFQRLQNDIREVRERARIEIDTTSYGVIRIPPTALTDKLPEERAAIPALEAYRSAAATEAHAKLDQADANFQAGKMDSAAVEARGRQVDDALVTYRYKIIAAQLIEDYINNKTDDQKFNELLDQCGIKIPKEQLDRIRQRRDPELITQLVPRIASAGAALPGAGAPLTPPRTRTTQKSTRIRRRNSARRWQSCFHEEKTGRSVHATES